MSHDGGYGPKGVKKFSPNGAPDQAVDLEEVGKSAADVGNRKVGLAARRAALSTATDAADQRWPGLEFFEEDTGKTFLQRTSAFEQIMQAGFKALAPSGDLGTAYPATDADPLIRIGYGRFAPLNASGGGALTFPEAFPNRCALLLGITIEGSAVNPVVSSGNLSRTGATLVWQGGNTSTTVRFLYLAIGF
jgi:hypothetical protein